jgi:hypothetical membrane protein
MSLKSRALFGPLAAVVFGVGIVALAALVPGYDQVRQTVSEIGEMGSPMRWPFAILLFVVSAFVLIFATALRSASLGLNRSTVGAWLAAFMAVSATGIGIFAFPHPLHNVFGISELIAYQAPLALALAWRNEARVKSIATFSWIACLFVYVATALNLVTLDRQGVVWAYEKPIYGLIQRLLFASWFAWAAGVGLLLASKAEALRVQGPENAAA